MGNRYYRETAREPLAVCEQEKEERKIGCMRLIIFRYFTPFLLVDSTVEMYIVLQK